MARLLPVLALGAALLLLAPLGAHSVEHVCIHDEPHMQQTQAELLRTNPTVTAATVRELGHEAHAKAVDKIRIVVDGTTMSTAGKYCTSTSDTIPTFATTGETIQCTSDAVLTAAKRSLLLDTIIPKAIARIQAVLSVEQLYYPIRPSSTTMCWDFAIPPEHVSNGVANADLVIYVAAGPIGGSTVAFAGACASLASTGRSVIGRMNFDPEYWPATAAEVDADGIVDTAVHEITHILGVTGSKLSRSSTTVTKRGKSVKYNRLTSVVEWVRAYTGCSTLEGGEIEDEGSSGSSGSHWERKVWLEELMAPSAGSTFSGLSLALLEGLDEGYTATGSETTMTWGKEWGCGIHDSKCDTAAGGKDVYYCFEASADNCTFNLKSVGTCFVQTYSADLPAAFQYFSDPKTGGPTFMDGCPYVLAYSNRKCSVARTATATEQQVGHIFQSNSRCYYTNPGLAPTGSTTAAGFRCLASKCDSAATTVTVAPGTSTNFSTCPEGGSLAVASGTGFAGTIQCPADAAAMCASIVGPAAGTTSPDDTSPTNEVGDGSSAPNVAGLIGGFAAVVPMLACIVGA